MSSETDGNQPSDPDRPPEPVADWLTGVLPLWVDDGVINAEQAAAIRQRHGLDESVTDAPASQSRGVTAVFLTSTVGDALPSSLALVVIGVVLLVLAVGLERGRRSLLDRL